MENITYEEFIQNILDTRGRFACGDEYHERHHIIPVCLGGGDEKENLIDLYAREHFEAHRLLALENPDNEKLIYAWACMSWVENDSMDRYQLTPKEYEETKVAYSQMMREKMLGENNPMYGQTHSEEARKKISKAAIQRCNAPERRQQLSEQAKKPWENDEYREQKRQIAKDMWSQDEFRQKMIEYGKSLIGEKNPFYGKHHTEETKQKLREKSTGRKQTEETKQKMAEFQKKRWTNEMKEEWGQKFSGENNGMYGKHHSEEAKNRIGELNGKPVIQFDNDDNFISRYRSGKNASEVTGISQRGIMKCCQDKQKTAGGYKWKYEADYMEEINEL